MINRNTVNSKPVYNDIFLRILFSLFAAHFIVVYGDTNDIGTIIRHFNYYNALVVSFIIAFLVLYFLWLITRYLDKKLDWLEHIHKRIIAQVLLGIAPPALIAAGLATIYFRMYGYSIFETPYFSADFPVILVFITMANVYYFIYYMVFHFWPKNAGTPVIYEHTQQLTSIQAGQEIVSPPEAEIAETDISPKVWRETYLVQTATKSIPIKITEIAYFYRLNGCNFLRTFNNEDYPISEGLKDIEAQFSPELFFRINRQVIVSIGACSFFRNGDREGTLIVDLSPVLTVDRETSNGTLATVSEDRVKGFKAWIGK